MDKFIKNVEEAIVQSTTNEAHILFIKTPEIGQIYKMHNGKHQLPKPTPL